MGGSLELLTLQCPPGAGGSLEDQHSLRFLLPGRGEGHLEAQGGLVSSSPAHTPPLLGAPQRKANLAAVRMLSACP